jgi:hypothetical protein
MFSALLNAQNVNSPPPSVPITSVNWVKQNYSPITSNETFVYNGQSQSIIADSVVPSGATYTTSTTSALNVGGPQAVTTITGTGAYTGTFTSPTITITPATFYLTSSSANNPIQPTACGSAYSNPISSRFDVNFGGMAMFDSAEINIYYGSDLGSAIYCSIGNLNTGSPGELNPNPNANSPCQGFTVPGVFPTTMQIWTYPSDSGNYYWVTGNYPVTNSNYTSIFLNRGLDATCI